MRLNQFQQELLFFVRNSEEAITPQNVAYYIKIPIEEAKKHLESLSDENIVLIDSDDDGNIIFTMPNTPRRNNIEILNKHFFPEVYEKKDTASSKNNQEHHHHHHHYNKTRAIFIGKKRSILGLFLLTIFFPFYPLIYFYSLFEEAKQHSEKIPFGGLGGLIIMMIPFLNLIMLANYVIIMEEEDKFRRRTFSSLTIPVILSFLSFLFIPGFLLLLKINEGFNRHWDYHQLQ